MRILKIGTQKYTKVIAIDERGSGNANHEYHITWDRDNNGYIATQSIKFQNGPIKEQGVNGIQNEDLICIVIDRLEGFQSGDFACEDNGKAIADLHRALANLRKRTDEREARGVEGTHTV